MGMVNEDLQKVCIQPPPPPQTKTNRMESMAPKVPFGWTPMLHTTREGWRERFILSLSWESVQLGGSCTRDSAARPELGSMYLSSLSHCHHHHHAPSDPSGTQHIQRWQWLWKGGCHYA